MKRRRITRFLTFLDLISCSFGAAVLIFLISEFSAEPKLDAPENESLIVRCKHVAGAKSEVRIEYLRPGTTTWLGAFRGDEAGPLEFAAQSDYGQGAEAFVFFANAAEGEWKFRAYRAASAKLGPGIAAESTRIRFEAHGAGLEQDRMLSEVFRLGGIGDGSAVFNLRVRSD